MDREKIIEKLEKEVKRTYAIKTAMYECGKKGHEKISEEITEHREPFVTLTIEMADKILALLKEQEPVEPVKDIARNRRCPKCFTILKGKFCYECGQAVKWDD